MTRCSVERATLKRREEAKDEKGTKINRLLAGKARSEESPRANLVVLRVLKPSKVLENGLMDEFSAGALS